MNQSVILSFTVGPSVSSDISRGAEKRKVPMGLEAASRMVVRINRAGMHKVQAAGLLAGTSLLVPWYGLQILRPG